ncbi:MAG: hypothetical protein Q4D03_04880 [Bacteroidales bacterium]|nr:hypothetical protein [Bacteroidales bacterium]
MENRYNNGSRAFKEQRLAELRRLLNNYEELDSDLENDEYVARGNGFCDAKYSEDFVEGQIARIKEEIATLESSL